MFWRRNTSEVACCSENVEQSSRRSTHLSEHWHIQKEIKDVFILQILSNLSNR